MTAYEMRISDWSSDVCSSDLAGPHPVLVAHHRVDLAVVGDQAVRVRERPRREGVGGEARVHEGKARLDPLVGEVCEEVAHLVADEHALVDEGARREAREVHGVALRSDEHTSELQSLMRITYAVFCLNIKKHLTTT